MNQRLESILNSIRQSEGFSAAEKKTISQAVEEVDNELAHKDLDLKIEAALERVRAQAMTMRKSEELSGVSEIIFTELKSLGFSEIRNMEVIINNDTKETITSYYYSDYVITGIIEVFYKDNPTVRTWMEEMRKANDAFAKIEISPNEMDAWRKYRESIGYLPDPKLDKVSSVYYYSYSIGLGALSVSTFKPITEEQLKVLERFRNVFGLAYRRYADVMQAEAQAREAKIEAALERVRAKAMAMHSSEDLAETVNVFFKELKSLGVLPWRCGVGQIDEETHTTNLTTTSVTEQGDSFEVTGKLKQEGHPVLEGIYENWKLQKEYYPVLKGDDIKAYYEVVKPQIAYPDYPIDSVQYGHIIYFKEGFVFAWTENKLSENELSIFRKFTSVLSLTYRRYLDLKEAEAQARESQIELALERVRARTMAMQRSDELAETAYVLFQQFKELGEAPVQSTIGIMNEEEGVIELWLTVHGNQTNRIFKASIDEPIVIHKIYAAWKEQKKSLVIELAGKELYDYNNYREKISGIQFNKEPPDDRLAINVAFFSKGLITISTPDARPQESIRLLERFAGVFDLTYTRFLDLKQAESQAKEAKTEAALEKVRAVAMSMNKPDDLLNICEILFKEFHKSGFSELRNTMINIHNDDKGTFLNYDYSDEIGRSITHLNYNIHPVIEKQIKQIRSANDAFSETVFTGKELEDWKDFRRSRGEKDDPRINNISALHYYLYSIGTGSIGISTFSSINEEKLELLKRFRNVFILSYQRYLDIALAEAQAREAQIEAALERVRSKAMAMQKSEDLAAAVATVFEELDKLKLGTLRCGIGIIDKEKRCADVWTTTISDRGTVVQVSGDESIDIHPLLQGAYDAWLRQEDFSYVLEGEDLIRFYKALTTVNFRLPDSQSILIERKGLKQYYHLASFQAGNLYAFRETPFPEEAIMVMRRFADVFNLTYTRYNDLRQAEAQAREARIETALERVRSVAMSMMKSNELLNVCESAFTQLQQLGFADMRNAQIYINYDDKGKFLNYFYSDYNGGEIVEVLYDSHPKVYDFYTKLRKANDAFADYEISGAELEDWKFYLNNTLGQKRDVKLESASELHYYFYSVGTGALGICTFKPIHDEELQILKRFRNVFNLSYQRYTDIALAEAQAREAKIEAGLERVRSRTLAMYKSDELAETAAVVFKQLIGLGIEPNRLYIAIIKDDSGDIECWVTDEDGSKVNTQFTANRNRNESFQKMHSGWKEQKKSLTIDMQGKELEDYFHYLSEELKVPFKLGLSQKRRVQNIAYFSKGFIGIASPDSQPEETTNLLERFAGVFNLTYTRFSDLQQAEVQTHKALIETALERVRARALAMQQPEELIEVALVLRNEMGLLGVEEIETGTVFIFDEASESAQFGFTAKDIFHPEKPVVTDTITLDLKQTWAGREFLQFFKSEENQISLRMEGVQRREWIEYIYSLSPKANNIFGENIQDKTYHMYKFSNGAVGAASPGDISAESWNLLSRAASVFSLAYSRFKDLTKARFDLQQLIEEKKRSDSLLLNILPAEIAEELKRFGKSYARKHEQVSILFADIQGFSSIAEKLSADELVTQLDECFRAFDHIVEKHGMEKIKTIGDAYVCACGLPKPVPDNAARTVKAAIDMLDFVKGFGLTKKIQNLPAFEFRVGINTGPVVTGVVGLKKFTYDIWGDAVNMAARMEQHGEAGKINISGSTYQLIKDRCVCTYRGKIQAKNKGEVDMYFVEKIL